MEISHARPPGEDDRLSLDQMWGPAPRSDSEPPEINAEPIRYGASPALITVLADGPGPHAVLHTPEEAEHLSPQEVEAIREASSGWDPTRREKALIHYAADGAYEEVAAQDGHDTPLCYILAQIRQASSQRSNYDHEPRRFSSGVVSHG